METVFFAAVAIVVLGTLGLRHVPERMQGFSAFALIGAIVFVVAYLLWALIEPLGPISRATTIILALVVSFYGLSRFKELIDQRRDR